MKVRVAHGARRHEVLIPGSTTIADLKDKLQQLTGVPAEAQDLQMMGDSLCDEASLAEQGVQDRDKLDLVTAGSPLAARVPPRDVRSAVAPSGSVPVTAIAAEAAEATAASNRHPTSRDASPKPKPGGGGGGSAPLEAALHTLDGVVTELDTMDGQARATHRRPHLLTLTLTATLTAALTGSSSVFPLSRSRRQT